MNTRLGLLLLSTLALGCISEHNFGSQTPTVVAAGSPEGEVYSTHGCPDQIIELGNPVGPGITHWNKYLVVYRMAYGSKLLGSIMQEDEFTNVAYLIENGKVMNGGRVGGGTGTSLLGTIQGGRHARVRAGYGGDDGYAGSYGQSGRRGAATAVGQNARDGD